MCLCSSRGGCCVVTAVTMATQTAGFFVKDQAKSLALQMLLVPLISLGLLYTIQAGGQAFFLYAWLFLAAVTFVRQLLFQFQCHII